MWEVLLKMSCLYDGRLHIILVVNFIHVCVQFYFTWCPLLGEEICSILHCLTILMKFTYEENEILINAFGVRAFSRIHIMQ